MAPTNSSTSLREQLHRTQTIGLYADIKIQDLRYLVYAHAWNWDPSTHARLQGLIGLLLFNGASPASHTDSGVRALCRMDWGVHIIRPSTFRTTMAPRKLIEVSEAQKKDPNSDRYIFAYMKVIWKEGDTFYVAHHPERESFVSGRDGYIPIPSFDLDSIPAPPPVPSRHLLATIEPGLTEAPAPLPENTYVKYPPIGAYNGTGDLGEILLAEAHTFEFLKKHPHPNICHYYGYVRDASGEYLAGLCLKRYRCTLYDAVQSGETFDRGAVINGVRAGIESLHSSGLVHNDLNPANIMFDYDGNVVIIDFDGCQRDGEVLGRKGGTYGWADPNARIATRANDFYALDKLVEYLTEGPGAAQPPA